MNKLVVSDDDSDKNKIVYHHTVFCQTALPYRSTVERTWERTNGSVKLRVEAGADVDPQTGQWTELPVPFGSKSRLILIHFDTLAILSQSPELEIEQSMTGFLAKIQGYSPNGRELADFRRHVAALRVALFRLAIVGAKEIFRIDTKIVTTFTLWRGTEDEQRRPSYVRLSDEYFRLLQNHAVPLNYQAVAHLKESALALDIYKWLAQRLVRVDPKRPMFLLWSAVQGQFGQGYDRIRDFRAVFLGALDAVLKQYPRAKVRADHRGIWLYYSAPPVVPKILLP